MMRRGPFFLAAAGLVCAGSRAMSAEPITHLEILHLSDALLTRAVLGPQAFETHDGLHRTSISDRASVAEGMRLVDAAGAHASDAKPDVRWALTFSDAAGTKRRVIYLDKFGKRAIVDGHTVSMDGAHLIAWLRARTAL